ncbi:MAG: hypothetical protein LBV30_03175 [Propionibacteriaceae bacterium]|jgi:predicted dehydrogenase|nr:hypothetical protein [Propionibacteriaceae bacterium]
MRFLQVGLGYRSAAFHRVLADWPGLANVGVVVRRHLSLPQPVFTDLRQAISATAPDFVLSFVPPPACAAIIGQVVDAGLPILAETPPAGTVTELDALADLAKSGLVQVAEQYPRMPGHAARRQLLSQGVIGELSQVQVSSTQTYHAMALIRSYLAVGQSGGAAMVAPDRPVLVRAARFSAGLVNPLSRAGWTDDPVVHQAGTVLASVDFGDGLSGVYDFTDQQTRNLLRTRRLLLRGSHGEISGDQLVRLSAPRLITTSFLQRRQTGHDLDVNGYASTQITLGDQALWVSPWPNQRWNDDELGIASLIAAMVDWVDGAGPAPYPLAEAIYDTRLGLAIDESVRTDMPVRLAA